MLLAKSRSSDAPSWFIFFIFVLHSVLDKCVVNRNSVSKALRGAPRKGGGNSREFRQLCGALKWLSSLCCLMLIKATVGTCWAPGADCHTRVQALESVLGIMPSQRTSAMQLPLYMNNGFVVATWPDFIWGTEVPVRERVFKKNSRN